MDLRKLWGNIGAALASVAIGTTFAACDDSAIRDAEQRAKDAVTAREKAKEDQARAAALSAAAKIDRSDLGFFKVLPQVFDSEKNALSDAKITLGRMLYYEPRLSLSQTISCNSCHDLTGYGVDNQPTSPGHKGQRGGRNSPTVYNAGGHFAQFWDGRAATVEDQAKGPILNPIEMAMPDEASVLKVLKSIPQYVDLFKAAFPDDKEPVTYDNLAKAIGAFERKLTTPSRWDKFLAGDADAITQQEKAGFAKFSKLGCPTCHNGANVGGAQFQKLGLVKPYPDQKDLGRYEVTKIEADKMFFRVPSLRNVEKTGPYFHNGSLTTLDVVVRTMAAHQLGQELKDDEVAAIVAFLKSLTGEIPKEYVAKPELPPNGPTTPPPRL